MDMQFKCNGKMVISFSGEESGSVEDFDVDINDKVEIQSRVAMLFEEVLSEYIDIKSLEYDDFDYEFIELP